MKTPDPKHYHLQTSTSIVSLVFGLTDTNKLTRDLLLEACRALKLKQTRSQNKSLLISLAAYAIWQIGWVGFLPNADGSQKDGRAVSLGSNDMEVCASPVIGDCSSFVPLTWERPCVIISFLSPKVLNHDDVAKFSSQVNSECTRKQALAAERSKHQKENKTGSKSTSQQRWFKKPKAGACPI